MRILVALLALSCCACSTLPTARHWGQDATIAPGWDRVKTSAVNAARDPWVWAPLAGAALFQIDDWDERTSHWARENTPVFGSQRAAEDWSDHLRNAAAVAHIATLAATPSGEEPREWFINKSKGTLVYLAALGSTGVVTRAMKRTLDRDRPNGADDQSFPSGHTSMATVHTRLASRNLRALSMSEGARISLDVGLYALSVGTAWSRIEAGWHYPSDTLFSMALGNFVASFANDAFLGLDETKSQLAVVPSQGGAMLQWTARF